MLLGVQSEQYKIITTIIIIIIVMLLLSFREAFDFLQTIPMLSVSIRNICKYHFKCQATSFCAIRKQTTFLSVHRSSCKESGSFSSHWYI